MELSPLRVKPTIRPRTKTPRHARGAVRRTRPANPASPMKRAKSSLIRLNPVCPFRGNLRNSPQSPLPTLILNVTVTYKMTGIVVVTFHVFRTPGKMAGEWTKPVQTWAAAPSRRRRVVPPTSLVGGMHGTFPFRASQTTQPSISNPHLNYGPQWKNRPSPAGNPR
jgi:hypothetical protein